MNKIWKGILSFLWQKRHKRDKRGKNVGMTCILTNHAMSNYIDTPRQCEATFFFKCGKQCMSPRYWFTQVKLAKKAKNWIYIRFRVINIRRKNVQLDGYLLTFVKNFDATTNLITYYESEWISHITHIKHMCDACHQFFFQNSAYQK